MINLNFVLRFPIIPRTEQAVAREGESGGEPDYQARNAINVAVAKRQQEDIRWAWKLKADICDFFIVSFYFGVFFLWAEDGW